MDIAVLLSSFLVVVLVAEAHNINGCKRIGIYTKLVWITFVNELNAFRIQKGIQLPEFLQSIECISLNSILLFKWLQHAMSPLLLINGIA